ncbi:unnamed protein product [Schistosoma curassoni]|uniref:Origin recognition complex subunit 4 n=1 Tax=Schistosoma curassoni TaxID=6186 RepID=A0A183KTQ4_9TREM|nr:unnamed protein product [Schistosoma curassoni]
MDLICDVLRMKLRGHQHRLLYFDKELKYLQDLITSTVSKGESSSILIIGRRGVGKHHLIKEAIKKARENSNIGSGISEVYLNGLIHTDDRSAMKSLAKQLHNEALLNNLVNSDCNPASDFHNSMKNLPFSQQLNLFLNEVRQNHETRKAVLIVLSEFDLFALHHNQLLLYNLFDCCQSPESRICIIGLTCRLDVMELLEKRVKSRFSHRQIYLTSPGAPIENTDSYASDNNDSNNNSRSEPFKRFCEICKHLLSVDIHDLPPQLSPLLCKSNSKGYHELELSIKSWNHHITKLMVDEIVIDSLRQAWSISVSIKRLVKLLGVALMLSRVARNALVGWESNGSRIIKASFKTKKEGITMNIIQCYVPTNDSNDDIKDQFYEQLQSIIEKCPRKDLTIPMGDLNAKVGIDNTGYEDIMG